MPDPTLHGNHDTCPACALQQEAQDKRAINRTTVRCQLCRGFGFIPLSSEEIIRRMVAEACRLHWPAFDRRQSK